VSRAARGDQSAFEQLYRLHAGRVKAYVLRSGFSPADADDRVAETFVRAFGSLGTFDARRGSFRTWLAAIARNVVRKHWLRRTEAENFDPHLAEEMFEAPENPGDRPEHREEVDAVRDCVARLPVELGRIVRLRYVEGRTTRSIAAEVDLPESTVRLRLTEAAGLLQQCLEGKGILE